MDGRQQDQDEEQVYKDDEEVQECKEEEEEEEGRRNSHVREGKSHARDNSCNGMHPNESCVNLSFRSEHDTRHNHTKMPLCA